MHAGSIDNPDTAAHRVYMVLKSLDGNWIGGWDLTIRSQASAILPGYRRFASSWSGNPTAARRSKASSAARSGITGL